jgi:hypothetical protein
VNCGSAWRGAAEGFWTGQRSSMQRCPPGPGPGGRPARAVHGRGQAAGQQAPPAAGARRPACTRRVRQGPGSWPDAPPAAGLQATPARALGGRPPAGTRRREGAGGLPPTCAACTRALCERPPGRRRGREAGVNGRVAYLVIGLGCSVVVIGLFSIFRLHRFFPLSEAQNRINRVYFGQYKLEPNW